MIFRVLWAVDDVGHRLFSCRVHRLLLGRVCDWLDGELCRERERERV